MPNKEEFSTKIKEICSKMALGNIDYCILSNNDPNFSNSPSDYWSTLKWLFDFTDDNASFLLTKNGKGFFFTDERYRISMSKLFNDTDIKLIMAPNPEIACFNFLCDLTSATEKDTQDKSVSKVLAIDDKTTRFSALIGVTPEKRPSILFKSTEFLNQIWHDRPLDKKFDVFDIENIVFPGTYQKIYKPRKEKLREVLKFLNMGGEESALMFTSSADIAFLLNIRAFSNEPSTLLPSFLILSHDTGYLFAKGNFDENLLHDFNYVDASDGGIKCIRVFPYSDYFSKAHFFFPQGTTMLHISDSSCASLISVFPSPNYKHMAISRDEFETFKSMRTEDEVKGMQMAFDEDSRSAIKFIASVDLKANWPKNEWEAVCRLEEIRKKSRYYICPSFDTIFALGPNGAMPHYVPTASKYSDFGFSGLAVFDFGGQYDFGTTDTTRTLLFGLPHDDYRYYYTAILKAHLYLQMFEFEDGIQGYLLDAYVRSILIRYNISTPHGIGHGVSMLGDVHDTSPRLSTRLGPTTLAKIRAGMCFTVEPGVYLEDKFGIRIENTVVAKSVGGGKLRFVPLTLVPYERRLIDIDMLDDFELEYINSYHQRILDRFLPELNGDEKVYLQRQCAKLVR